MYNLNFAPNENSTEAWRSLRILLQPDIWYGHSSFNRVRERVGQLTQTESTKVFLMLSARGALCSLLRSLHLPPGSEVIVQGFTCEAVVLPIIECHLTPIYVDIEPHTFSMDIESLQKAISGKTKIIILQHSFGMTPLNRVAVLEIAHSNNILVIEDLAHGFYPAIFTDQDPVQTIKLLSFGRSKLLSAVHGGAIVITQTELARAFSLAYDKLPFPSSMFVIKSFLYKMLAPTILFSTPFLIGKVLHKVINYLHLFTREISQTEKEGHYDSWLEKQFPNALAALLLPNLQQYEKLIQIRKNKADIYQQILGGQYPSTNLPLLRFPLLVNNRQAILDTMKVKGIVLGTWYKQPIAPTGLDLAKVQYRTGSCPEAEQICQKIINLPNSVTDQEAHFIAQEIRKLI
jgi:perosamine synthetase